MAEEGFLSRWARRKNAATDARPEAEPEEVRDARDAASDAPHGAGDAPHGAAIGEKEVAETEAGETGGAEEAEANRQAAEAVDLETIGADTDMSVFFREGVPSALKAAALRQLWRSDPVFACVDGLNDYDIDYTGAGEAAKAVVTRWQVGRGFSQSLDEREMGESGDEPELAGEARSEEDRPDTLAVEAVEEPVEPADEPERPAPLTATDGTGAQEPAVSAARVPDDGEAVPVRISLRRRMALAEWPNDVQEEG